MTSTIIAVYQLHTSLAQLTITMIWNSQTTVCGMLFHMFPQQKQSEIPFEWLTGVLDSSINGTERHIQLQSGKRCLNDQNETIQQNLIPLCHYSVRFIYSLPHWEKWKYHITFGVLWVYAQLCFFCIVGKSWRNKIKAWDMQYWIVASE